MNEYGQPPPNPYAQQPPPQSNVVIIQPQVVNRTILGTKPQSVVWYDKYIFYFCYRKIIYIYFCLIKIIVQIVELKWYQELNMKTGQAHG